MKINFVFLRVNGYVSMFIDTCRRTAELHAIANLRLSQVRFRISHASKAKSKRVAQSQNARVSAQRMPGIAFWDYITNIAWKMRGSCPWGGWGPGEGAVGDNHLGQMLSLHEAHS